MTLMLFLVMECPFSTIQMTVIGTYVALFYLQILKLLLRHLVLLESLNGTTMETLKDLDGQAPHKDGAAPKKSLDGLLLNRNFLQILEVTIPFIVLFHSS
jgi:hypothetical protein